MNGNVGIVTFHNHPNYGAVLQAYALKSVLEEQGWTVSFICDRRKPEQEPQASVPPAGETEQEKRARRTRELLLKMSRKPIEDQKRIFTEFAARHFNETELTAGGDLNGEFAFFVAGSDQVWNSEITNPDPFWFLDFAAPEKRFSYAASFGMDALPESWKDWYRKQLKGFARISVREQSGQRIVEELTAAAAQVCPDPVFLPETQLWDALGADCPKAVVAYMIEFDEHLYRAAQKRAEELGLPLIYITNVNITPNSLKRTFCTPEEWVGYFRQAQEVYTNSFHGLSFSCLFHKPVCYRGLQRLAKRNNRIENLLQTLGAEKNPCAHVEGGFTLTFPAGWDGVDAGIAQLRQTGRAYLRSLGDGR